MTQPAGLHRVERLTFFTDAVVAIAMTLLILPLLESVNDASRAGLSTHEYLREHAWQLGAFALSFTIIGTFWRRHDRMFQHVAGYKRPLFLLNLAWLITIVWLPVVTAIVGSMPTDSLQVALYIGTLLTTGLITLAMQLWLARNPHLMKPGRQPDRAVITLMIITNGLFVLALTLALAIPRLHYWSLLVLLLMVPAEWLVDARRPRE